MSATTFELLRQLDPRDKEYAIRLVETLLAEAQARGVSDVHFQPTRDGIELRWRVDGALAPLGVIPRGATTDVVARLKVLAGLLTYRTETPQEGRIRQTSGGLEMRVSTFPTLYGERAAVRIFASSDEFRKVADLGLPDEIAERLVQSLQHSTGAVLVTGPAGSGKTTTLYACARELAADASLLRSVVTLEDPIESALDGVAQSQVNPAAGFDLAQGLRSVLRQDPEVVLVGEMRDRATVEGVFSAALTGHLVLTSFHAGSAAEAISRLGEMGIEPYLLRSAVSAVLHQRLVRRLCECGEWTDEPDERLGYACERVRRPVGCAACQGVGYRGRLPLAEWLEPNRTKLARAILDREDAERIGSLAREAGMVPLAQRAFDAVARGLTSPREARRVTSF